MKHPFFESIDWNKLKNQEIEPPLKINLKSPNDIKYFDPQNSSETQSKTRQEFIFKIQISSLIKKLILVQFGP